MSVASTTGLRAIFSPGTNALTGRTPQNLKPAKSYQSAAGTVKLLKAGIEVMAFSGRALSSDGHARKKRDAGRASHTAPASLQRVTLSLPADQGTSTSIPAILSKRFQTSWLVGELMVRSSMPSMPVVGSQSSQYLIVSFPSSIQTT